MRSVKKKKIILTVIGTRPEAIKLIPVLSAINKSEVFKNEICITRQHQELLEPFIGTLKEQMHYLSEIDQKNMNLSQKTAYFLNQLDGFLGKLQPDVVIVQGDTTTAFAAAMAAFYRQIPVVHVEAGLRTGRFDAPWPEEAHRCFIDRLANYFFAPTKQAYDNLVAEGIEANKIWLVGNTSIDAVRLVAAKQKIACEERFIVVTIHRRENHGEPLKEICCALKKISENYSNIKIIFFLHPNPAVCYPAIQMLSSTPNIKLNQPLDHASFICLMQNSVFVITDSGGIQEEVSFLGKASIIIRDVTERAENIHFGTSRLSQAKSESIIESCVELIENPDVLKAMEKTHTAYGDGFAAERIVKILESELG